ncbi:hypothetical protein QF041_005578 [Paenibacillus sp. W2I17]|nr:hypothetical protein [Paenibacillus sp. W2I17]
MMLGYDLIQTGRNVDTIAYPAHRFIGTHTVDIGDRHIV